MIRLGFLVLKDGPGAQESGIGSRSTEAGGLARLHVQKKRVERLKKQAAGVGGGEAMSRLEDEPLFTHMWELLRVQPCLVSGGPSLGHGRSRTQGRGADTVTDAEQALTWQEDIPLRADRFCRQLRVGHSSEPRVEHLRDGESAALQGERGRQRGIPKSRPMPTGLGLGPPSGVTRAEADRKPGNRGEGARQS